MAFSRRNWQLSRLFLKVPEVRPLARRATVARGRAPRGSAGSGRHRLEWPIWRLWSDDANWVNVSGSLINTGGTIDANGQAISGSVLSTTGVTGNTRDFAIDANGVLYRLGSDGVLQKQTAGTWQDAATNVSGIALRAGSDLYYLKGDRPLSQG